MFIKLLKISKGDKIIREILFKKGINLIIDETPKTDSKATGNNVGKTTVLTLVDFCLGNEQKAVYSDLESKEEYKLVKDFLVKKKVLITLILKKDLEDEGSKEIKIERNFLLYKDKILKINDKNFTEEEFPQKLTELIIPEHNEGVPTFRQIISHNIRYEDQKINNTLKTLNKFSTDAVYESLYLFLFGCGFSSGDVKQEVLEKIRQESLFKSRLEKQQTKTAYEAALVLVDSEIKDLKRKKESFNLNKNFEQDLDKLNKIKYNINQASSDISKITIRKDLIIEAEEELNSNKSKIDLEQLKLIYQQATDKIENIQKTFDDLVEYHDTMITEKVKFIKKTLPDLEKTLNEKRDYLKEMLREEKNLTSVIIKSDSFEELEVLISELNEGFRKKGEYESIVKQFIEVENNLEEYNKQLDKIDNELFSDSFEKKVVSQLKKFNEHFSFVSNKLYGESYGVKHDIVTNKKKQRLYKFTAFNTNLSSGKKQGEIFCFDIAYIMFANKENISCLNFLLNDKKELVHHNQLVKISEFINNNNLQFVASILKDKLPKELDREDYFAVKLSQENKLFKIESEQGEENE